MGGLPSSLRKRVTQPPMRQKETKMIDKYRVDEFLLLQRLVNVAEGLNDGSHILEKISEIIIIAKRLNRNDCVSPRRSFMSFLNDFIYDQRETGIKGAIK